MECHKCPLNGKGDSRCIKCVSGSPGIAVNNHGRVFVSSDALTGKRSEPAFDPTEAILAEVDAREGQAEASSLPGVSADAMEVLGEFLKQLMLLDPREWRVLSLMVQNVWQRPNGNPLTLAAIGERAAAWLHYPKPISKQEVKSIVGDVFAKVPALAVLFPRMSVTFRWKQQMRRDGVLPHLKRSRGVAQQATSNLEKGKDETGAFTWTEEERAWAARFGMTIDEIRGRKSRR